MTLEEARNYLRDRWFRERTKHEWRRVQGVRTRDALQAAEEDSPTDVDYALADIHAIQIAFIDHDQG